MLTDFSILRGQKKMTVYEDKESMSTFKRYLVNRYQQSGMSERAFADYIGVKYTTFRAWMERGSEPKADSVEAILHMLGGDMARALPSYEPPAELIAAYAHPIRVLGEVSAGHALIMESPIEEADMVESTIKKSRFWPHTHGEAFALRVVGDSMEPTYPTGSLIACRPPRLPLTEIRAGTPCIFTDQKGSTFKNFHYDPDAQVIYGLPINRDHDVHQWDPREVHIQGIAVGILAAVEPGDAAKFILREG